MFCCTCRYYKEVSVPLTLFSYLQTLPTVFLLPSILSLPSLCCLQSPLSFSLSSFLPCIPHSFPFLFNPLLPSFSTPLLPFSRATYQPPPTLYSVFFISSLSSPSPSLLPPLHLPSPSLHLLFTYLLFTSSLPPPSLLPGYQQQTKTSQNTTCGIFSTRSRISGQELPDCI